MFGEITFWPQQSFSYIHSQIWPSKATDQNTRSESVDQSLYQPHHGTDKSLYKEVDFLCGDFSWKKLFHLTPRPLYEASNIK